MTTGAALRRKRPLDESDEKSAVEAAVKHIQVQLEIGGSINVGTPVAGWFISWKIRLKWMMTGGHASVRKTSICHMPLVINILENP